MVIRLVNKTSRRRTCDLWLLWTRSFQKWPNMTGFRPGIEAKGVKGAKPWAVFRWSLQWGDSWARAHGSAVPWYCWDMKQKVMEMWIHCKWLGGYNFHHFSVGCVYGMVWPVVAAGILKPLKDPRWKNFHRKFKGNQVIGGKRQPTYDINDSIFSMYNYIHRYIIYIYIYSTYYLIFISSFQGHLPQVAQLEDHGRCETSRLGAATGESWQPSWRLSKIQPKTAGGFLQLLGLTSEIQQEWRFGGWLCSFAWLLYSKIGSEQIWIFRWVGLWFILVGKMFFLVIEFVWQRWSCVFFKQLGDWPNKS